MPRITHELQGKNIKVFCPLMPTPRKRNYETFKTAFDKYDIYINENSVLV
ncbi:MAG: hypothetical protein LBG59_06660 [Candidatus Peribacteria bacterium]|jgi:hypothetical protein|nr:hypothetical protein [Candidatus Peribacteria bacterium]